MVAYSDSVHEQVTLLCEKILKNYSSIDHHSSDAIVKDLRSLAFEILLNKSNKSRFPSAGDELDAVSKILAYSYTLHERNWHIQAIKLNNLMDNLVKCKWGNSVAVEAVLLFLSCLAEVPENGKAIFTQNLPHRRRKVKPYLEFVPDVFQLPGFQNVLAVSKLFCKEPGVGLSWLSKKNSESPKKTKWFQDGDICFSGLSKPYQLKIPKLLSLPDHQFKDEGYGSPSQEISMTLSSGTGQLCDGLWDLALSKTALPHTWESLGSLDVNKEKPYLTEASPDCVQKFWKSKVGRKELYINPNKASDCLLSVIDRKQLIRDLKYLLVGVPSQTFQHNEKEDGFVLENRICIEGLSPGTLHLLCKDFIIAGSCYMNLMKLITKTTPQEGLMFQALCGNIQRYLHFYRCAVMMMPEDTGLLNLHHHFYDLYIQITSLAFLCKVHPHLSEQTLPEGVALLAYLYKEIQKVTRKDVACILYSALQACCQVYFSFLQKWMFEGVCQDVYSEFFIQEQSDLMTCRQRQYWSQGHYLLADAVPGFLSGLEEAVFQCGKTLNLLKLCNSQDVLCIVLQSGYPQLQCCLHSSDFPHIEAKWLSYQHRAIATCGEPINLVQQLFQTQEDWAFQVALLYLEREGVGMLKLEREMELAVSLSVKSKQFAVLKAQMEYQEAKIISDRKERLDEEKKKEIIDKMSQEKEAKIIEEEKIEMTKKYLYIAEVADERRVLAEKQIQQIQSLIGFKKSISHDEQDCNKKAEMKNAFMTDISNTTLSIQDSDNELQSFHDVIPYFSTRLNESDDDICSSNKTEYDTEENNGKEMIETCSSDNLGTRILKQISSDTEKHMYRKSGDKNKNLVSKLSCPVMAESLNSMQSVQDSSTTFETASSGSEVYSKPGGSAEGLFQRDKCPSYQLQISFEDTPLVEVGENHTRTLRSSSTAAMDVSTIDISSISTALQKSILVPLKIQARLVNSALLKFFLEDQELLYHLHNLRKYFLLLDGEFGRNVTNSLFTRMYTAVTPVDMLNSVTLNSILSKSLTQADPNVDYLSFDVKYVPQHFSFSSPSSLDCITLQYKVKWPLNIILTDTALSKYNEVFSFLLRLRRISWVLEEDFNHLKRVVKRRPEIYRSPQYHRLQLYRHEMTHFINAIQNYVTASVLQASWVEFLKNLQSAYTLDDLYKTHVVYVKMVLFKCLLNKQSASIQKALIDTLRMVLKFHGQLYSGSWHWKIGSSHYSHSRYSTLVQIYDNFHQLAAFIFKFASKLANTGYQPHLLDLLQMLNMNGFYPENFQA